MVLWECTKIIFIKKRWVLDGKRTCFRFTLAKYPITQCFPALCFQLSALIHQMELAIIIHCNLSSER